MLLSIFTFIKNIKTTLAALIVLSFADHDQLVINQSTQHKIIITISGKEIIATLNDSKTSRDFISMLPLDLPLEDYASTEKIGYLPRRLATENEASGNERLVGDVAYYVPWGNLALFYKGTPTQGNSLIVLGKIDSGKEVLQVPVL